MPRLELHRTTRCTSAAEAYRHSEDEASAQVPPEIRLSMAESVVRELQRRLDERGQLVEQLILGLARAQWRVSLLETRLLASVQGSRQ